MFQERLGGDYKKSRRSILTGTAWVITERIEVVASMYLGPEASVQCLFALASVQGVPQTPGLS